jgi:hypothetical protein
MPARWLTSPKSTIEHQKHSGALANPADPDAAEHQDQRIGNRIVGIAYGTAFAILLGAFYIGMLWLGGGS